MVQSYGKVACAEKISVVYKRMVSCVKLFFFSILSGVLV